MSGAVHLVVHHQKPPAQPGVCPCGLWTTRPCPPTVTVNDPAAVELGVKFRPTATARSPACASTRARRTPARTPARCGRATGTRLATVTFTGESTAGWQQAELLRTGRRDGGYHLHRLVPHGHRVLLGHVERPGGARRTRRRCTRSPEARRLPVRRLAFPTTASNANYWVDLVYVPAPDTTPPTVTSTDAGERRDERLDRDDGPGHLRRAGPSGSHGDPARRQHVGVRHRRRTTRRRGRPRSRRPAALAGRHAVHRRCHRRHRRGRQRPGGAGAAGRSPPRVRRRAPARSSPTTRCPACPPSTDSTAVEVGVKFRTDTAGCDHRRPLLQGHRQHRHAHRHPLDRRPGSRLATGTFTGETATGWQQLTFATPVAVTREHHLRRVLLRPAGPLRRRHRLLRRRRRATGTAAPRSANGVDGRQRRLPLRHAAGFPTTTFGSSQLLGRRRVRDPQPTDTTPPHVHDTAPVNGATSVAGDQRGHLGEPRRGRRRLVRADDAGPDRRWRSGARRGHVRRDLHHRPPTWRCRRRPYTATVTQARDLTGQRAWPPGDAGASPRRRRRPVPARAPCSADSATPSTAPRGYDAAVELGVRFSSRRRRLDHRRSGSTRAAATPARTPGSLWSSAGTRLATGTFAGETASGWQTADVRPARSRSPPAPATSPRTSHRRAATR